jgi:putative membrane protein
VRAINIMKTKHYSYGTPLIATALGLGLTMGTGLAQQRTPSQNPGQNPTQNPPNTELKQVHSETLTPESFAKMAYWAGNHEVQLSQLAVTKAQDAEVRSLAQKIVTDHTMANEQLKQIAQRKGFDLPAAIGTGASGVHSDSTTRKNADGTTAGTGVDKTANVDKSAKNADGTPARKPEYADDVGTRQDRATELEKQRADGSRPYSETEVKQHAAVTKERLQTASGAEFDRQYLTAMLQGHEKAISKYQTASQQLNDAELKAYASATLPKLREHQDKVRSLAQARGISTSGHSTDANRDGSRDGTREGNKPVDRDPAGVRPK